MKEQAAKNHTAKDQAELVCRLKKSICGLKRGARVWHACVDERAAEFGMKKVLMIRLSGYLSLSSWWLTLTMC